MRVLFITLDQWRGDSIGNPLIQSPALDGLAADGVHFKNHWSNAAPCGPARACLYTGTYLHTNRAIRNGTPLDGRFENVATVAREAGLRPVLFGYTDTSIDPRTVRPDDPRLLSYEGILPGFDVEVHERWEDGSPAWGRWLAAHGVDVPSNPHQLFDPIEGYPGADDHGPTWAPAQFPTELSQAAFMVTSLLDWYERHGDESSFVHASFIASHPPRRCPVGFHDLYDADDGPGFRGALTREEEAATHPFAAIATSIPGIAALADRRQLRATYHGMQTEVDSHLGRLFDGLRGLGLWDDLVVVVTADHGEMGGDHWLTEKLGWWDESYAIPLIVRDPSATLTKGRVVEEFTEAVDLLPSLAESIGADAPRQCVGGSLRPFLDDPAWAEPSRDAVHFEWHFSDPVARLAEGALGIPSSHCSLAVSRSADAKFVQFAADADVLPPLYFDLASDPEQITNLALDGRHDTEVAAAATSMLRWRIRSEDPTLTSYHLGPHMARPSGE